MFLKNGRWLTGSFFFLEWPVYSVLKMVHKSVDSISLTHTTAATKACVWFLTSLIHSESQIIAGIRSLYIKVQLNNVELLVSVISDIRVWHMHIWGWRIKLSKVRKEVILSWYLNRYSVRNLWGSFINVLNTSKILSSYWPSNTPTFIVLIYSISNMFRLIIKSSSGPYIQIQILGYYVMESRTLTYCVWLYIMIN
jgi:hypothetical protein